MKCFAILAAAAFMLTPTVGQEAAMPSDGDIAKILSDRIGRDQASVGIAVAILEDGATRFVSHGTLAVDDATSVDEKTLFEAGSITKTFTNVLLGQFAKEGLLDLDAPVLDYLPAGTVLPSSGGDKITLAHLATHSAGLTGLPSEIVERGLADPYTGVGRETLLGWLKTAELAREVGSGVEYSNAGTALIGVALEEVSGKNYEQLLSERILTPLGMSDTKLSLSQREIANMATGHDNAREPISRWDFDVFAPAGALVTNAHDLAKFIAAAVDPEDLIVYPSMQLMIERNVAMAATIRAGMGVFITDIGQGDIIWHNGGTGGFRSFAGFEKMSGNGVVVLSNMATQQGVDDIGMHLLNPSMPLWEQPAQRTEVAVDADVLPIYLGQYGLGNGAVFTITAESEQLFAQLTGQDSFPIFAEAEHKFFYKVVDAQLSFEVVDGKAVALVLHQNGLDQRAQRID